MDYRKTLVQAALDAYFACLASMNSRNIAYWHKLMGEVIDAGLFSEYCAAKQMESSQAARFGRFRTTSGEIG